MNNRKMGTLMHLALKKMTKTSLSIQLILKIKSHCLKDATRMTRIEIFHIEINYFNYDLHDYSAN